MLNVSIKSAIALRVLKLFICRHWLGHYQALRSIALRSVCALPSAAARAIARQVVVWAAAMLVVLLVLHVAACGLFLVGAVQSGTCDGLFGSTADQHLDVFARRHMVASSGHIITASACPVHVGVAVGCWHRCARLRSSMFAFVFLAGCGLTRRSAVFGVGYGHIVPASTLGMGYVLPTLFAAPYFACLLWFLALQLGPATSADPPAANHMALFQVHRGAAAATLLPVGGDRSAAMISMSFTFFLVFQYANVWWLFVVPLRIAWILYPGARPGDTALVVCSLAMDCVVDVVQILYLLHLTERPSSLRPRARQLLFRILCKGPFIDTRVRV